MGFITSEFGELTISTFQPFLSRALSPSVPVCLYLLKADKFFHALK